MSVCIKGHDYRLEILFDVLKGLSRGCTVTVNEGLLAKRRAQQRAEMATDDIIAYVVKDTYLVFIQIL